MAGEVKIQTPKIVEKVHVPREFGPPVTCVMGLQCKALTISQTKNVKKIVESGVPLTPKTTGNQVQHPKIVFLLFELIFNIGV